MTYQAGCWAAPAYEATTSQASSPSGNQPNVTVPGDPIEGVKLLKEMITHLEQDEDESALPVAPARPKSRKVA